MTSNEQKNFISIKFQTTTPKLSISVKRPIYSRKLSQI